MQQGNKNRTLIAIMWALVILCMGTIFYFSSRTATESAQQSGSILDFVRKILGDNAVSDFIVRKLAHFSEYTGLALLVNIAFYVTKNKKQCLLSVGLTSLYAVTDEVHQIFVDGRSCEFRDWGIDTCGAILGTIIFIVLLWIISKIVKKSKNNKNTIDIHIK